jgi:excisionase family DNA binding protein
VSRHLIGERSKPPDSDAITSSQLAHQAESRERDDKRIAYSVAEAALLTGLSRDLLYDQMRCGKLSYIKVGRRRIITRQHLNQFLGLAS